MYGESALIRWCGVETEWRRAVATPSSSAGAWLISLGFSLSTSRANRVAMRWRDHAYPDSRPPHPVPPLCIPRVYRECPSQAIWQQHATSRSQHHREWSLYCLPFPIKKQKQWNLFIIGKTARAVSVQTTDNSKRLMPTIFLAWVVGEYGGPIFFNLPLECRKRVHRFKTPSLHL